ncbi:MFS transporter [Brachybacterium sillae]|uniref:MFS transporter n=1 Tax=Brachybacterium sillae TaxID=2810536 RepID=UPI00217CDBAB|nr:MFS transporter [Brachybacterium sillae]
MALAAGIFVLITIEELPIGVLTLMAQDLGVSTGTAGLTVTVPGLFAALVSLVVPVVAGRLDRRLLIIASLVAVILSCLLTVLAPDFRTVLAARLLTGLAIGLNWSVLPVVAIRQGGDAPAERSLALAFSGIGAAVVLGVPLASWLGAMLGWRAAFGLVGALAAVVLIVVLFRVRPVPVAEAVGVTGMRRAAAVPGVRAVAAVTLLAVTGQFAVYSYVSPLLQQRGGVGVDLIGPLLLGFGVAGLLGNFAIGPVLERGARGGLLLVVLGIAGGVTAFALLGRTPLSATALLLLWGLCAGALSVAVQAAVVRVSTGVEDAATAINGAAFNASIACGALVGGLLVDRLGLLSSAGGAVALLLAAAVLIALAVPGGTVSGAARTEGAAP